MVIAIKRYKIAYMPVPKAACSAVKEALARIDPAMQAPAQIDIHTWHIRYPTQRFRPHRWQRYADHWRFCVLRDPLERLLSVYTNRVRDMEELRNSPRLRRDPAFADLPSKPDPDTFFQNLDRYRAACSAVKHHAFPCWLFTGPRLTHFDAIYRVSELDALASALSERCGQTVTIGRRNLSAAPLTLSDLQPRTQDSLRAHLAPEYRYLAAFYENPFGTEIISLARKGA